MRAVAAVSSEGGFTVSGFGREIPLVINGGVRILERQDTAAAGQVYPRRRACRGSRHSPRPADRTTKPAKVARTDIFWTADDWIAPGRSFIRRVWRDAWLLRMLNCGSSDCIALLGLAYCWFSSRSG
jgi:hypothetical protein